MRYEGIVTENEKEREMAKLIREFLAEAARGNVYTRVTRLIDRRAYGNHAGGHNSLQTLTAFKRGISIKSSPGHIYCVPGTG